MLDALQLTTYHPALEWRDESGRRLVHAGLDEFREHLGGQLTILLLQDIGVGINVHHIDEALLDQCIDDLHQRFA